MRTFLLDPGHGGVIDGVYTTAPNKMFEHEDGTVFYEGVWNREICRKIVFLLSKTDIKFIDIVSTNKDKSLRDRVKDANELQAKYRNCVYISIHSNAGGGRGFEVFTSPGKTLSDTFATIMLEEYGREFALPLRKDYSDGDPDKEANFYVLKHTKMPAILTENLFYDNPEEVKLLLDQKFQWRIANAHFNAIKRINDY